MLMQPETFSQWQIIKYMLSTVDEPIRSFLSMRLSTTSKFHSVAPTGALYVMMHHYWSADTNFFRFCQFLYIIFLLTQTDADFHLPVDGKFPSPPYSGPDVRCTHSGTFLMIFVSKFRSEFCASLGVYIVQSIEHLSAQIQLP